MASAETATTVAAATERESEDIFISILQRIKLMIGFYGVSEILKTSMHPKKEVS
jgi:hypothetical protein